MEITYHGNGAFLLKGTRTVAFNYGAAERPDVTLHSTRQRSRRLIINGPGEYELRDVLVLSVPAGAPKNPRLAHALDLDGISVVLLDGDPATLDGAAQEAIGKVDVLVVNANGLEAAQAITRDLSPRVVLPFGDGATALCEASGVKDAQPQLRFSWNGVSSVPRAVLLKAPGRGKRAA